MEQETEQAADAEPDRRGTHDYVSVPNKLGNDSSITKDKGSSEEFRCYYKAEEWSGMKAKTRGLDSVIERLPRPTKVLPMVPRPAWKMSSGIILKI